MDNYVCHYGGDDMTCKDCKHYIERPQADWYTFNDIGFCDMACRERIIVNEDCPVNKWCDNKFEPKENSWESVSK